MSSALQHCPECDEEYVAGVAACVECGGPLQPGPLARLEERHGERREPAPGPASAPAPAGADHLLAELPGQEADHLVRMLLLEGIDCRVVCQGIEKRYVAGQPPAEPFAITLPVTIFVADTQRDAAADIVASFQEEDVIGEQWDSEGEPDIAPEAGAERDEHPESYEALPLAEDAAIPEPPQPTGTSARAMIIVVAIGLVLLYLFAR